MRKLHFLLIALTLCSKDLAAATHRTLARPKGIPNIANTCYLNSLLQALCATSFVESTAQLAENNKKSPTAHALNNFFNAYFEVVGPVVEKTSIEALYQFLTTHQTALNEPILYQDKCFRDTNDIFGLLIAELDDEFLACTCNIHNPFTMEVLLRSGSGQETDFTFEGGKSDFISKLNEKKRLLVTCPQIFLVTSVASAKLGPKVKGDGVAPLSFKFPLDLSLKPYLAPEAQEQNTEYSLVSIIMYSAGAKHYTAGCSRFADTWYFCNDASIEELSFEAMADFSRQGYLKLDAGRFIPRTLFYERVSSQKMPSPDMPTVLQDLSSQLATLSTHVAISKQK